MYITFIVLIILIILSTLFRNEMTPLDKERRVYIGKESFFLFGVFVLFFLVAWEELFFPLQISQ
jgi:hypothetical protein